MILALFEVLALWQFTKFGNFIWIQLIFLSKNPSSKKLHDVTDINMYVLLNTYTLFYIKVKFQKYFLFRLPEFSFFPTSFSWIHSFPGSESNTKGTSLSNVEAGDIWFSRSSCSIWRETSVPKIIRINTQCTYEFASFSSYKQVSRLFERLLTQ